MALNSKAALYALINRDNDVEYTEANVSMGPPTVNVDTQLSNRNTAVTLSGIPEAGKTGSVTVYYDRVNIDEAAGGPSINLVWGNETRIINLIPKLDAILRTNLTTADIVDNALPDQSEDGSITFELVMASGSYGWTGSLTINLGVPLEDIAEVIEVTDLNGLFLSDLQDPA